MSIRTYLMLASLLASAAFSSARAAEMVPIFPDDWLFSEPTKKTRNVDVLDVKALSFDRAAVRAHVFFEDNTDLVCRYLMNVTLVDLGGRIGMQFTPESKTCESAPSSEAPQRLQR